MGFPLSQACYSRITSQIFLGHFDNVFFFLSPSSLKNIKRQEKNCYKHAASVSGPVRSVKFRFQISKPLNLILLLSFQHPDLDVVFICYCKLYLEEITPPFFFKSFLICCISFQSPVNSSSSLLETEISAQHLPHRLG